MIVEPVLRWIFTVAVAAAGALHLYRGRRASVAQRVTGVLHLITCGGMIAMAWPAAMNVARMPQILLYGFAAAWFVGSIVFDARGRWSLSLVYHAAMPAAMLWMVAAMPTVMRSRFSAVAPAAGEHTGMSRHGAAMTMSAPVPVVAIALLLAAAFASAGVFWLAQAIGAARATVGSRLPVACLAADAVMGLGMAVMAGLLI